MTTTVPESGRLVANSPAIEDHFAELSNFVDQSEEWTIDAESDTAILTSSTDQQVCLRIDAGYLFSSVDPGQGIADPDEPESTASDEWSGEVSVDLSRSDFQERGTVSHVALFDDLLVWTIVEDSGDEHCLGVLGGYLIAPWDLSDEIQGTTGQAVAIGRTRFNSVTNDALWGGIGSANRLRVAEDEWVPFTPPLNNDDDYSTDKEVGGVRRFPPVLIGNELGDQTPLGYTKYFRVHYQAEQPMSVLPSSESDLGWLFLSGDSSDHTLIMAWNKTVTP